VIPTDRERGPGPNNPFQDSDTDLEWAYDAVGPDITDRAERDRFVRWMIRVSTYNVSGALSRDPGVRDEVLERRNHIRQEARHFVRTLGADRVSKVYTALRTPGAPFWEDLIRRR